MSWCWPNDYLKVGMALVGDCKEDPDADIRVAAAIIVLQPWHFAEPLQNQA
jgi:hypothetical protein